MHYVNRNGTHCKSVRLLQESEPVGAQTGKSVNDVTNVEWPIAVDVEQSQPMSRSADIQGSSRTGAHGIAVPVLFYTTGTPFPFFLGATR